MEQQIIEDCWRDGLPLPKKIQDAPELAEDLRLYWEAYADLSTCRPLGFSGPGSIPWTAVQEWAQAHRLSGEQGYILNRFVRRMDEEFLSWHRRKYGNEQKPGGVRPAHVGARPRGRRRR